MSDEFQENNINKDVGMIMDPPKASKLKIVLLHFLEELTDKVFCFDFFFKVQ